MGPRGNLPLLPDLVRRVKVRGGDGSDRRGTTIDKSFNDLHHLVKGRSNTIITVIVTGALFLQRDVMPDRLLNKPIA